MFVPYPRIYIFKKKKNWRLSINAFFFPFPTYTPRSPLLSYFCSILVLKSLGRRRFHCGADDKVSFRWQLIPGTNFFILFFITPFFSFNQERGAKLPDSQTTISNKQWRENNEYDVTVFLFLRLLSPLPNQSNKKVKTKQYSVLITAPSFFPLSSLFTL